MLTREGVEPHRSDHVSIALIINCSKASSPAALRAMLGNLGREGLWSRPNSYLSDILVTDGRQSCQGILGRILQNHPTVKQKIYSS